MDVICLGSTILKGSYIYPIDYFAPNDGQYSRGLKSCP